MSHFKLFAILSIILSLASCNMKKEAKGPDQVDPLNLPVLSSSTIKDAIEANDLDAGGPSGAVTPLIMDNRVMPLIMHKRKPWKAQDKCNTSIFPQLYILVGQRWEEIRSDKPILSGTEVYFATAGGGKCGDVNAYFDRTGDGNYSDSIQVLYNNYLKTNSTNLLSSKRTIFNSTIVEYRAFGCEGCIEAFKLTVLNPPSEK